MNSAIINAQRNQRTDNRMRLRFRCIEWDTETQRGCLLDRFKFQYEVTASDLLDECDGSLDVGEYVSGTVSGDSVTNILIETGPRAVDLVDRKAFSDEQKLKESVMSTHGIYEVPPRDHQADFDDSRFQSNVQELNYIFDQMMRSKIRQLLYARPEIETTVQLLQILNLPEPLFPLHKP
jgi:hypothetical protein